MTKLVRFLDNGAKGTWANIRMDNGDPCWIGIAQTGILVKKSKVGLFGRKIYEEKDVYKCAEKAKELHERYPDNLTPDDMIDPVLKSISNSVLHCNDLVEVTLVLNQTESS